MGINSHFSEVSEVTSGGLQGPALELTLFSILIEYFKNGVTEQWGDACR